LEVVQDKFYGFLTPIALDRPVVGVCLIVRGFEELVMVHNPILDQLNFSFKDTQGVVPARDCSPLESRIQQDLFPEVGPGLLLSGEFGY